MVEPPIWKICSSDWESFPQIGMKIKNVWNHHLVFHCYVWLLESIRTLSLLNSCWESVCLKNPLNHQPVTPLPTSFPPFRSPRYKSVQVRVAMPEPQVRSKMTQGTNPSLKLMLQQGEPFKSVGFCCNPYLLQETSSRCCGVLVLGIFPSVQGSLGQFERCFFEVSPSSQRSFFWA